MKQYKLLRASSIMTIRCDWQCLAVPYEFLLARLPEPPDGLLKSALSLGLILLVYSLMIIKGILRLWLRLLAAYLIQIDARNIFVRFGRKRRRKPRPMPTLHIKMFVTNADRLTTFLIMRFNFRPRQYVTWNNGRPVGFYAMLWCVDTLCSLVKITIKRI